jgi:hypothetical protein
MSVKHTEGGLVAEGLITMPQAAKLLPKWGGKSPACFTVIRYITRGLCGVRLEGRRMPTGWVTSVAAIQRFVDALHEEYTRAAVQHEGDVKDGQPHREVRQRSRVATAANAAAEKELDALGIV